MVFPQSLLLYLSLSFTLCRISEAMSDLNGGRVEKHEMSTRTSTVRDDFVYELDKSGTHEENYTANLAFGKTQRVKVLTVYAQVAGGDEVTLTKAIDEREPEKYQDPAAFVRYEFIDLVFDEFVMKYNSWHNSMSFDAMDNQRVNKVVFYSSHENKWGSLNKQVWQDYVYSHWKRREPVRITW